MKKQEIRNKIRQEIKLTPLEHLQDKSSRIANQLQKLEIFKNARSVFIYSSLPSEVDTKSIINNNSSKKIYLPVVDGDIMQLVELNKETIFHKGAFGIEEPSGNFISPKVDVNIIPLLACDRKGNRVGKGKGYYDRYLKNSDGINIALAFSFQVVDVIDDIEAHDIKMDFIITEDEVIKIESNCRSI